MTVTRYSISSDTWTTIIKTILTIAALWFLFSMITIGDLLAAWERASWPLVAVACALVPVHIALRAYRWRRLLRDAGETTEAGRAVRTVLVGYVFAVTTPAEVGEVAARVKLHEGAAGSKILGLVVVEKLLHSSLILVPGLPAIALFFWGNAAIAWLIAVTASVILLFIAAISPRLGTVSFDSRKPRFGSIARMLRAMGSVPRRTLGALALSTVGIFVVYVAQEYLLMNAVLDLGFVETWNGFWAGMGVRTLAPFFIMDLGIREASHVLFFGRYGVDASSAMAVSLLMFALNILIPSVAGLVVMFRKSPAAT